MKKLLFDLSLFEEGNILEDVSGSLLRVHYPSEGFKKPWQHRRGGEYFFGAIILYDKDPSIIGEYVTIEAEKFSPYSLIWKEPKSWESSYRVVDENSTKKRKEALREALTVDDGLFEEFRRRDEELNKRIEHFLRAPHKAFKVIMGDRILRITRVESGWDGSVIWVESDNKILMTGIKHDSHKSRVDLISPVAIEELGMVLKHGVEKYGEHNWRGGIAWSRLIGASLRHLLAFMRGEDLDPESGLSHVSHAMCNLMMLSEFSSMRKDLDDRYFSKKSSDIA